MNKLIILFVLSILLNGCTQFKWLKKNYPEDNIIEELVEDIIEDKTGLDIDLSYNTPESKEEE